MAAAVAEAAAVAVAAVAVVADAESAGEVAAHRGAHAAGAEPDHPPGLIDANCHGRVRQGRPGQCMFFLRCRARRM